MPEWFGTGGDGENGVPALEARTSESSHLIRQAGDGIGATSSFSVFSVPSCSILAVFRIIPLPPASNCPKSAANPLVHATNPRVRPANPLARAANPLVRAANKLVRPANPLVRTANPRVPAKTRGSAPPTCGPRHEPAGPSGQPVGSTQNPRVHGTDQRVGQKYQHVDRADQRVGGADNGVGRKNPRVRAMNPRVPWKNPRNFPKTRGFYENSSRKKRRNSDSIHTKQAPCPQNSPILARSTVDCGDSSPLFRPRLAEAQARAPSPRPS